MATRKLIALLLLAVPHHVEIASYAKAVPDRPKTTLQRMQEKVLADEKKRRPLCEIYVLLQGRN